MFSLFHTEHSFSIVIGFLKENSILKYTLKHQPGKRLH